ncbi:HEAT repeat domain-containing protein [Aquibacillus koreensis]|uniref:HEAT repeat domain-containing protein n=1 Tax=Aquibacillus koreensis TaxID=279446 RepID=A0A9X4AHA2_9BACI|nr:HEAT repeat domain-containing protein [Aquibacillus koreensis]MCT2534891.1 HEAT repeat domain-containing protein [Aquibacillus koreensis]MDC3419499.1 HEAT repeat domain-containing protein [Aquibacillus koreensis]
MEVTFLSLFMVFVVMLFILISIFLYLLTKKVANNQTRAKINQYKEAYRLDMFQFLQAGKAVSFGNFQDDQEKFIACKELLQEYANVIASEDMKERINDFAKDYLTSYIQKELKRRRWSLRMNALYLVEEFEMAHLTNELSRLYNKRKLGVLEKTQLLKLFALFDHAEIMDYLKNNTDDLSEFALMDILSVMTEARVEQLADGMNDLPMRFKYIVVEVIGKKQLIEYHPLLRNLIIESKEEIELKIRAFKAMVLLGMKLDSDIIEEALESEHWQLRMMAARLAGVHRLEVFKDKLISLLSDSEYAVRAEAAKAILTYKGGAKVLQRVVTESSDPFAKDMATEWLEKESVFY